MKTDFIRAINQICAERRLTVEVVLNALEQALVSAYKRDFGPIPYIEAKIDPSSGEVSIFTGKEVVQKVEDPTAEMDLAQAVAINPDCKLGDIVYVETTPPDFGRIAAQTAKQVILQRIREAERDALYEAYIGREGEIVSGTVQSIDARGVGVNLGRIEAIVPRSQQVVTERHYIKQKLRVLIIEVNMTNRGPEIIASRSHPDMLRRLLEVEVPEIYNGLVEIKAIAREAGSRAKVAVSAVQQGIDPVGACVGMRGVRIQSIVSELNGEKIDVIGWSPKAKEFITKSLSPARPLGVELTEDEDTGKTATVIVPDNELSLAIGREGQNARLAAKLTGWRIDIISATEAAERAVRRAKEEAARAAARAEISEEMPLDRLALSKRALNSLAGAGIAQLGSLLDKMEEDEQSLLHIKGFGPKSLRELEEVLEQREVYDVLDRDRPTVEEKAELEIAEEAAVPVEHEVRPSGKVAEEGEAPVTEPEEPPTKVEEQPEAVVQEVATPSSEVAKEIAGEPPSEEIPEEVTPEAVAAVEPAKPEPIPEDYERPPYGEGQEVKKKRSRRRLVYDETLGEVVARKVRKPGRQQQHWERALQDWEVTGAGEEESAEEQEEEETGEHRDAS